MRRQLSVRPFAALVLVAMPSHAAGQSGPKPTASAMASVEVVGQDLNLSQQWVLAFGLVKSRGDAGTVVVKPEAVRTPFGGAETVGSGICQTEFCEDETNPSNPDSASYWGPGKFQVTGSPGASYRVSAAAESIAYWRTPAAGRVPELKVRDFTFVTASSGGSSGILDSSGVDTIRIGGTLIVPSGMKTASYRVQVPITVQYN